MPTHQLLSQGDRPRIFTGGLQNLKLRDCYDRYLRASEDGDVPTCAIGFAGWLIMIEDLVHKKNGSPNLNSEVDVFVFPELLVKRVSQSPAFDARAPITFR